ARVDQGHRLHGSAPGRSGCGGGRSGQPVRDAAVPRGLNLVPGRDRGAGAAKPADRTVATNRRARHEYAIEETYEAGLVLTGPEVKSLRAGRVTLSDAYARVDPDGSAGWIENMHIPAYEMADTRHYDPKRRRKLLLHRGE